ncbi:MAG: hypothetical protein ACYC4R_05235 [Anaerolineae bacterium]
MGFPIRRLCQMMGVSTSGYDAWSRRPLSGREMANRDLVGRMRQVQAEA